MVDIFEATEVNAELLRTFERLIPQLSASNPPPTETELTEIVSSPATTLLIARDPSRNGEIVGSLTLVLFRIPTGLRAWLEDLVVDGGARREGVGEALNRAALARARAAGATTIGLTSRPSREAANRLYQRLGFVQHSTNVYRYTYDD